MAFISVTTKESRIMKKIYSFVFAAVALFSAASCQDELVNNETPAVQGEKFTITAIADAQTKTALTDEGFNSVWTPGDAIAVIDFTGQGAEFTTAITENAASAKFTCEDFNVGGMADISALPIVALYPYQAGLTCSIQSQMNPSGDNTIKGITFPNEQTAVAGSFDKTAAFTWAMATGATKDNLVFNNLYSLLKVKVTEENITEIKVTATSGSLAGNVTLPMTQSGATLTVVDGEGKSEVTLTCEAGFDTDEYYYICVLPGTYEGFSIALNGYTVKTKASPATFAAATVYDLGNVDSILTDATPWGVCGTFTDGWNITKNMSMTAYADGWYRLEGVEIYKDDEFKFVTNNSWDNSLGGESVLVAEDKTEYSLVDNGQNIKVTKNGVFTISLNPNEKKFTVACTEEFNDLTVQITVKNERTWSSVNAYFWVENGDADVDITTSPGPSLSKDANGNYVYEIDGQYIGQNIGYIFSDNGNDATNPDYFKLSHNGNNFTIAAAAPAKFYFQLNTDNSKQWWGETAYLHVWTGNGDLFGGWPGKLMIYEGDYKFSCEVPAEYIGKSINFKVHNGNAWEGSNQTNVILKEEQTYLGSNIGIN